MSHKNGAEIFAAWVLILQVASKCDPRGTLLRGGKKPHDSASLALKTRAPEKWFKLSLEFLETETDWLDIQLIGEENTPTPHPPAGLPHPSAESSVLSIPFHSVPSGGESKGEPSLEKARVVLFWLNEKAGRHYRETSDNLESIERRLSEVKGDVDGVKLMIERQCKLWNGTAQSEYLRPETLFGKSKFSGYYDARDLPVIRTGGNGKPQIEIDYAKGF